MEDRSALFNQLKNFSQRKLKKVETKVVTASGEQLVEKRGAKGLQVLSGSDGQSNAGESSEPPRKLDLQVGFIVPGLLIGSQDVAHDKSSLDSYGITHILNLDEGVANKFEDDYNYKNINIEDKPNFDIIKTLDDCFDFIDDGRHYGNVLVHCSGTIGLSRSTSVCIAFLMNREKQKFDEAFNSVKEARSFVKPNEGFIKQLKEYEVKLRGAEKAKDSGIDDPFALRKKQEIEQEKAMVAGAASVKNRMKMFGATLDANANQGPANRSKSVSPMPSKPAQDQASNLTSANRWTVKDSSSPSQATSKSISKSMTPEPRKSWQQESDARQRPPPSPAAPSGPPPPPPPMPPSSLMGDKSVKPLASSTTSNEPANKTVFNRVPPPMKIKGGMALERQDSSKVRSSLQLPLKRQSTDHGGDSDSLSADNKSSRSPSPSAALRAAKQQTASRKGSESESTEPSRGLNRSSTKKILNLIKTKTKSDLTLPDGDENDEIDALLGALENETIDNIDWDELGLDEAEIKDIIRQASDDSSSSESEEEEDEDVEVEEEEEEVEKSTQHFIIRTK